MVYAILKREAGFNIRHISINSAQNPQPVVCQVAVSLSVANDHASLPIAYQLFLPEAWANDPDRRAKAGVPDTIRFETKTAIALGQFRQALADGVPVGIVLGDPAYGDATDFRVGVAELGLRYMLGVRSGTSVWPPGPAPPRAPAKHSTPLRHGIGKMRSQE